MQQCFKTPLETCGFGGETEETAVHNTCLECLVYTTEIFVRLQLAALIKIINSSPAVPTHSSFLLKSKETLHFKIYLPVRNSIYWK